MDEHAPTDEPLVIQLHLPKRQIRRLVVISVLLPVGAIVIFAADPSRTNGVYGALGIAGLAAVWIVLYAGRRVRRGAPNQLVATGTGISSPLFSLRWDRVADMRIGRLPGLAGGHRALFIEPRQVSDIEWVDSTALRLNARMAGGSKSPAIRIPELNVDRPLEQLAAELEACAGRPLLAQA